MKSPAQSASQIGYASRKARLLRKSTGNTAGIITVMERTEIERTIIEVIHSQKTLPEDAVRPEATLAEAGIDSLDALNILFELEEKFAISIPDPEAKSIRSIADLVRVVESLLAQKTS